MRMGLDDKTVLAAEAFASMNADLRARFEEIRDALAAVTGAEIVQRYRVGSILRDVSSDHRRYGKRCVETLAAALGVGRMTLYRHLKVAERWEARDVLAVQSLRNRLGQPLTWSHLCVLSERPASRDAWLEKTIANAWSARELEKEMGLGERASGRGDLSADGTTRSAIRRSLRQTEQWSTSLGGTMAPLVDRLEDVRAWTPELEDLTEQLVSAFRDAHRRMGEALARLERLGAAAPERSSPRLKIVARGR